MPELPTGKVTFLFTDIEGSTKLLDALGEARYSEALSEHRSTLRNAFGRHGGVEVDTQGDAFFVAFADAGEAVAAAVEAQEVLAGGPLRVRIGLHTGEPRLTEDGYVGRDVHRGARIAAAGHGGQVLLSKETKDRLVSHEAAAKLSLTDLGEHRVKDFAAPVWIYQLGSERFPPLRTISNTNLPRLPSSFIGREREVTEITTLLRDGARLVTLTGPGGTGKTRLAIEAAAELVPEFKSGTFWVDLAPLRDPALVTDTIAQTLGSKDGLAEHIGDREMLLLLDNLEQVVEAAPELTGVLSACPNLRVLATSRERLRVKGEVEYAVPPLASQEAVELFGTRAGLEPDDTIAELCRRLDDLPLAVELAAARTAVLSPAQILERLAKRLDLLKGGRDSEARQATLRATIAWSHELLTEEERRLFARLAVFAGGCTLEAAEQVADADLDILQSLVDKSLLRHVDERFTMLETIREYALEKLEASGEAKELRDRHAGHFLALAEEAEPHLFGANPRKWLDRLESELDNIRAALDTLEALSQTERVLRLAGALAEFWGQKGHLAEGRRRLESALGADERPTSARAKALTAASDLALGGGDLAAARVWAEEGLALHRELGEAWGTAASLFLLGAAVANQGDFAKARELLDESVRLFRALDDEHNALWATHLLSWAHKELGDPHRARELVEDTLRRARAAGDEPVEAISLQTLAARALDEGEAEDAVSMLKQAYRLNVDLGDVYRIAIIVCDFARLMAIRGRAATAARVLSCSGILLEEIGAAPPWVAKESEATLATIRTQLDAASFAEAWEEGKKLTADEAVALALAEMT